MEGSYILLTAAKNEADYISVAIESVLRQSVRPLAWFIVDDGSSDATAPIVARFAAENPFIRLISSGCGATRSFGAKDKAINAAYELARPLDFAVIGILDADIALERSDYYEALLNQFQRNPQLGITGGLYLRARSRHVAVPQGQLCRFRRWRHSAVPPRLL